MVAPSEQTRLLVCDLLVTIVVFINVWYWYESM